MSVNPGKLTDDPARSRLGRGLAALIGEMAAETSVDRPRGQRRLPTIALRPNPRNPRRAFSNEELDELVASLRERGIIQPIIARPVSGVSDVYEIIAGERRWRAAQRAGLHEVPVVIVEATDAEALQLAIIENVQRADLNAIEEAAAYHELMDRFGYTQERVSQEVGKSRSHIANTLRLLKLPESVKVMVRDGQLTAGHARTLLSVDDPEGRAREIVESALNVRQAEQRSKHHTQKLKKPSETTDPNIREVESSLSNWLGLRVQIVHKGAKGGELRISYKTLEQLDDLIHRLKSRG